MGEKDDDNKRGFDHGRDGGGAAGRFIGESESYYKGMREGDRVRQEHGRSEGSRNAPDIVGGIIGAFLPLPSGDAKAPGNSAQENSSANAGPPGGGSKDLYVGAAPNNTRKTRPFASTGVGSIIESIVGSVFVGIAGLLYLAAIAIGMLCFVAFLNWFSDGAIDRQVANGVALIRGDKVPARPTAKCDFADRLEERRRRITKAWISATICKDDGPFKVFVPSGTQPDVQFSSTTDLRPVYEFLQSQPTWGQPGGMPNLWILYVPEGVNGFTKASLDSVTLAIRAQ